jgi:hypothetical protein
LTPLTAGSVNDRFEYSRYAVFNLSKLKFVDAIKSCRRHGAPKVLSAELSAALIRLYEFLKNDSRSKIELANAHHALATSCATCPTKTMVEVNGIEPMTPCLQSRCSPS